MEVGALNKVLSDSSTFSPPSVMSFPISLSEIYGTLYYKQLFKNTLSWGQQTFVDLNLPMLLCSKSEGLAWQTSLSCHLWASARRNGNPKRSPWPRHPSSWRRSVVDWLKCFGMRIWNEWSALALAVWSLIFFARIRQEPKSASLRTFNWRMRFSHI